jgi:hypothetical protein
MSVEEQGSNAGRKRRKSNVDAAITATKCSYKYTNDLHFTSSECCECESGA